MDSACACSASSATWVRLSTVTSRRRFSISGTSPGAHQLVELVAGGERLGEGGLGRRQRLLELLGAGVAELGAGERELLLGLPQRLVPGQQRGAGALLELGRRQRLPAGLPASLRGDVRGQGGLAAVGQREQAEDHREPDDAEDDEQQDGAQGTPAVAGRLLLDRAPADAGVGLHDLDELVRGGVDGAVPVVGGQLARRPPRHRLDLGGAELAGGSKR